MPKDKYSQPEHIDHKLPFKEPGYKSETISGGGKGTGGAHPEISTLPETWKAEGVSGATTGQISTQIAKEAYAKFGKIDETALKWVEQEEIKRGISPGQTKQQLKLYKTPKGDVTYYAGNPPSGYKEISSQQAQSIQRQQQLKQQFQEKMKEAETVRRYEETMSRLNKIREEQRQRAEQREAAKQYYQKGELPLFGGQVTLLHPEHPEAKRQRAIEATAKKMEAWKLQQQIEKGIKTGGPGSISPFYKQQQETKAIHQTVSKQIQEFPKPKDTYITDKYGAKPLQMAKGYYEEYVKPVTEEMSKPYKALSAPLLEKVSGFTESQIQKKEKGFSLFSESLSSFKKEFSDLIKTPINQKSYDNQTNISYNTLDLKSIHIGIGEEPKVKKLFDYGIEITKSGASYYSHIIGWKLGETGKYAIEHPVITAGIAYGGNQVIKWGTTAIVGGVEIISAKAALAPIVQKTITWGVTGGVLGAGITFSAMQQPTTRLKIESAIADVSIIGGTYLAIKGVSKAKEKWFTKTEAEITTMIKTEPTKRLEKTAPIGKEAPITNIEYSFNVENVKGIQVVQQTAKGEILFKYPRRKVLEKATVGKPPEAESWGTVKVGKKEYSLTGYQTKRQSVAILKGEKEFITLTKTKGLEPISVKVYEAKGNLISEVGSLKRAFEIPYQKDVQPSFSFENIVYTKKPKVEFIHVGTREGGEKSLEVFSQKLLRKTDLWEAYGTQENIKGLKVIKQDYVGEAITTMTQKDIALPQVEIIKIGGKVYRVSRPSHIEYVKFEPSYEPNIKVYSKTVEKYFNPITKEVENVIIPVSKSVKKPKLWTERTSEFESITGFHYKKSKIKPVKAGVDFLDRQLAEGIIRMEEGSILMVPKTKLGSPVKIQTQAPKLESTKPELKIPFGMEVMEEAVFKSKDGAIIPIGLTIVKKKEPKPLSEQIHIIQPKLETESKVTLISKPIMEVKPFTEVRSELFTKGITKTESKPLTITKSLTKTLPKTMTETRTETKSLTETKALTKTLTETKALTKTLTETKIKTKMFPLINMNIIEETQKIPTPFSTMTEKKGSKLYELKVRRRGLFKTIGKFKSPKVAFLRGKRILETTAAASFKVEPLHEPETLTKEAWGVLPRKMFRTGKKEKDVYVQKRRFRISTGGEKREITFKGLETLRRQRANKGIFGTIKMKGVFGG